MNIHNTHVQTTTLMSTLSNHFDLKKIRLIKCTGDVVPDLAAAASAARPLFYVDAPEQQVQLGKEKIVFGVISATGCAGTGTLTIISTANSGNVGSVAAATSEFVTDTVVNNATAALCTLGSDSATASSQGYLALKTTGVATGTSGKASLTLVTLSS